MSEQTPQQRKELAEAKKLELENRLLEDQLNQKQLSKREKLIEYTKTPFFSTLFTVLVNGVFIAVLTAYFNYDFRKMENNFNVNMENIRKENNKELEKIKIDATQNLEKDKAEKEKELTKLKNQQEIALKDIERQNSEGEKSLEFNRSILLKSLERKDKFDDEINKTKIQKISDLWDSLYLFQIESENLIESRKKEFIIRRELFKTIFSAKKDDGSRIIDPSKLNQNAIQEIVKQNEENSQVLKKQKETTQSCKALKEKALKDLKSKLPPARFWIGESGYQKILKFEQITNEIEFIYLTENLINLNLKQIKVPILPFNLDFDVFFKSKIIKLKQKQKSLSQDIDKLRNELLYGNR